MPNCTPSPGSSGFAPLDDPRRLPELELRRLDPADDPRRERTFSPNSSASLKIRFSN